MSHRWVGKKAALAIHAEQIAHHGGLDGVRDETLLDSALAKPLNLFACEEASVAECASAYLYGIVRNHPFQDGNKRTGFVVAVTFLMLNGYYIKVPETDVVVKVLGVADGSLTENDVKSWFESIIVPA